MTGINDAIRKKTKMFFTTAINAWATATINGYY